MQLSKLILVILLFFNRASFAEPPVYTDKQTDIRVNAEQSRFVIKLPTNTSSTGYAWNLSPFNEKLMTLEKAVTVPNPSKLIGAPGMEYWTFKMLPAAFDTAQKTKLHFTYARSWGQQGDKKELIFTVTTVTSLPVTPTNGAR